MMRALGAAAAAVLWLAAACPAVAQLNTFTEGGLDLTAEDWELLETAASKLYAEEKPIGSVESWSNAQSGNHGTIELIRAGERQGMPCRRLQHDIKVKDVADPFRFTVDRCKTAEGAWKAL